MAGRSHPQESPSVPLTQGEARQRRGMFPWVSLRTTWRRFLRNTRGVAALESAIGAVVLVTASALAFDLYMQVTMPPTGVNAAVTVADYVSREEKPAATQIEALAKFLHQESFPQVAVAFVATAVQGKTAPQKPTTLWSKVVAVGPNATSDTDLAACSQVTGENNTATPPDALKLEADEIVIVAEVCVKQADGVAYYHHILPIREATSDLQS